MDAETSNRLGPALGKISSGIYITTARREGEPIGMLSSFIEQAGFEPPMVTVAVGQNRVLLDCLQDGGLFGINILSEKNRDLVKAFARADAPDPFDGLEMVDNDKGIPQLASAMAFLQCKVAGRLDAGDHTVVLAEVLDGILQQKNEKPMIRIRPNGFSY